MPQPSDEILARLMRLHPKIIDLTLDRVHRLLAALDHPETRLPPVIHVAGTNGKGSTQAMIRAGLEASGKTVHAYTSPHLARFHERIRLAGALISEPALSALLDDCDAANGGQPITFFEITTVAAFLAFARTAADFTLLEVGLGGRLDATNVIAQPALTIITPVSIDHQQYLGETLPEIAGEKAGILKRAVPCVVGPQHPDGLAVIEERAARLGVPLFAHGQHWHAFEERGRLIYQDETGLLDLPLPTLPGPHQIENAGAAIAALRVLGFGDLACEAAVTKADWPARMQRLRQGPLAASAPGVELWLDGGHNPAGGAAVAATLSRMAKRPTHLICGMLNTKDIAGYLRPLAAQAQSLTAVSIPNEVNTLPGAATAEAARKAGFAQVTEAGSVAEALGAIAQQDPQARVLICGSLYLAGQVLRENG
ncbi:bifunctional folylpolyglutamate synthase/dihydrofolate synthase [Rhodobacter capsulatus]|uniref:bifunctional folylpolyglutamate synthase/dihydrofolate synthase n=1 Tax=Rhodobacter capsulatus TaxID=1061 RepID=UPI0006DC0441|nr:folylpolyglutamate synthase/dihydrofolate synthase family protein [Rhodobacter capsulatus]KQB11356.1 bifunctional folylpolyglutamate synthase/dihydrofolate synthase [Rhodobacter capsulatus]KQB16758.1 bifunctional folylpolyglutamate synthase/dihydrofolate synthase [Rhodobacter capsulatus]PZX22902.1 dihydrofolate synthase/folylpolyglutamate synthase [Rhodobacter capsulatus]QNR63483.1 bifunctional folylpolyglutamate synthase/dihydrofolate synthase [Rhodobacter capsulatus]